MSHAFPRYAGAAVLSLFALAATAQDSPATPPSTMPSTSPSYTPPDAVPDAVTDAAISASLTDAYDNDADLGPLKLNVDTSDGNVSLHGIVPNGKLRDRAMGLAAGVHGVKTIENDIVVQK